MLTLLAGREKSLGLYLRRGLYLTGKFLRRQRRRQLKKLVTNGSPGAAFSYIYDKNVWGSDESRSGLGSTIVYTENLRKHLPIIFNRHGIKSIVDAPCGDFNWMRFVPLQADMTYIGIDIVRKLVAGNNERYKNDQRRFVVADITKYPLPRGDLLICRDCLFHLNYKDIFLVLRNFVESGSRFMLTGTHINPEFMPNRDIHSGDFRCLDLFSEPFGFSEGVLYRLDDFIAPHPPREMCLWDRAQVGDVLPRLSKQLGIAA